MAEIEYYDKLCKCGCGQRIRKYRHHSWKGRGIPEFINRHQFNLINPARKGIPLSDDHKEKIRDTARVSPTYGMKGKQHTDEVKRRLSEYRKQHPVSTKGKPMPDHVKDALRMANIGRRWSDKQRELCSDRLIGENNPNWHGGSSFDCYSPAFNKKTKRKIKERDHYTCQNCGAVEWKSKRPFAIHHVDYNKQNNAHDNLITLCPSCHSKSNFNRQEQESYYYNVVGMNNITHEYIVTIAL